MYIPIILGTARKGRQSEKVAKFVLRQLKKAGVKSEILDVRDYRLKATDNSGKTPQAKRFAQKVKKSKALIVVTPEYNNGYPGELKMMLDMLYSEYVGKKIGFCGVSGGPFGGVRAIQQLRQVAVELQMIPVRAAMFFPGVQDLFDKKGEIKDKAYERRAKEFIKALK